MLPSYSEEMTSVQSTLIANYQNGNCCWYIRNSTWKKSSKWKKNGVNGVVDMADMADMVDIVAVMD